MAHKWTLQYWAARKDAQWKRVSEKIRGPLDAMRSAWGAEVDKDVIFLIGLTPKPLERDHTRFLERYEIVDLGRNRKESQKLLEKLESQAKEERVRRQLLAEDKDNSVLKQLTADSTGVAFARQNAAKRLTSSGFASFVSSGYDELLQAEVFEGLAKGVLKLVEGDSTAYPKPIAPVTIREAVRLTFAKLCVDHLTTPRSYGYNTTAMSRAHQMMSHEKTGEFTLRLKEWLADFAKVDAAEKLMEEREAYRLKSVDDRMKEEAAQEALAALEAAKLELVTPVTAPAQAEPPPISQ